MGTDPPSRLPDPKRSRVLLVGTSKYEHLDPRPGVAANLDALESVLTDPGLGGLLPEHCRVVREPTNAVEVLDALEAAGAEAEDLLLVYIAGHGVLDHNQVTHFAVRETRADRATNTAVGLDSLRHALHGSGANSKVLIVDTCFSGQALRAVLRESLTQSLTESLVASFDGVFVIASTSEYTTAKALESERLTAFTNELVDLLRSGLPGGPPLLSLGRIFVELQRRLARRGLPEPRQASSNSVAHLALVRNAAGPGVQESTSDGQAEVDDPATFRRRTGPLRALLFAAAIGSGLGAVGLLSSLEHSSNLPFWQFLLIAFPCGSLCGLVVTRFPDTYNLVIDRDEICLHVDRKSYPLRWKNVAQVKLAFREAGGFDVHVRPMPGAIPQLARRWRVGPRRVAPGVLRMAEVHRLAATPVEVDEALRRFGGTAWLRCPEVDATRPVAADATFATRRVRLAVIAIALLLAGLSPLIAFAAAPSPGQAAWIVFLAGIWSLPVAALALAVRYPAELTVGQAGLVLRRGRVRTELLWSEVDRVALIDWPGQRWAPRFLYVHAPGRVFTHPWRRLLGLPPDVLACDLLSLGAKDATVSAVLAEFAGDSWSPDWLPETELTATEDRVEIGGRTTSMRTVAACAVAAAGTVLMIVLYSGDDTDNRLFTGATLMSEVTVLAAVGLAGLLVRSRCTLTADPTAVEITMGRTTARLEWRHIRHMHSYRTVTRVGARHVIEIGLTEDAELPRRWPLAPCFRQRAGFDDIMLCPVDAVSFWLNAPVAAVKAELARFAGPRRWQPEVRR